METIVFVNFPVKDLAVSTAFYEAIGFKKNVDFSNDQSSSMVWDEHFWIMLLEYDMYRQFLKGKEVADTKTLSGALAAFTVAEPAIVKEIARSAKEHGGAAFEVDMGVPEDQMYSMEVTDPDGNQFEPVWMTMPE